MQQKRHAVITSFNDTLELNGVNVRRSNRDLPFGPTRPILSPVLTSQVASLTTSWFLKVTATPSRRSETYPGCELLDIRTRGGGRDFRILDSSVSCSTSSTAITFSTGGGGAISSFSTCYNKERNRQGMATVSLDLSTVLIFALYWQE